MYRTGTLVTVTHKGTDITSVANISIDETDPTKYIIEVVYKGNKKKIPVNIIN